MGFIKARENSLHHKENGEGPVHPAAFREAAYRRWPRRVSTLARAVRTRRARAKPDSRREAAPVDGEAFATSSRLLPRTRASYGCQ